MEFVERPLEPGDPGFTSFEVDDWKVEASARKFLGDQVDVLFTLYRAGEKLASPRLWIIENEPSSVGVMEENFTLRGHVDAIPGKDRTRVTIRIEIEEDGVITRLPAASIEIR